MTVTANSETIRLEVQRIIDETADTRSFELAPVHSEINRMDYQPGQFLTLKIPFGKETLWRSYSFSSSPFEAGPLRITVRRVAGGKASNWLLDHLKPGMQIDSLPVSGNFTPHSLDGDFLLLAAGSGITPVFSILHSILLKGSGRCCLIYMSRNQDAVIFSEMLKNLSRQYPDRLTVRYWFDHQEGLPTQKRLEELAHPWCDAECFICGPTPFMEISRKALQALSVQDNRIHLEQFFVNEAPPSRGSLKTSAALQVELNGQIYRMETKPGELLLDAMLRNGLKPPSGCRGGSCGICTCHLEKGKVQMLVNQALSEEDVKQGLILACQSEPVTPELQISFRPL